MACRYGIRLWSYLQEALCAILDVGAHMDGSPLCSAHECLKLLAQHRLFSQSKDYFALVLVGTETTDGVPANIDTGLANVSIVRELSPYDWDVLETLNNGFAATSSTGDLLGAMLVGSKYLIRKAEAVGKIKKKRIIVLSNLGGQTDTAQLSEVIKSLQSAHVSVSIIGYHIPSRDELKHQKENVAGPSKLVAFSSEVQERVSAFSELLGVLRGTSFDFNEAIPSLFENRALPTRPWKVDLMLGEDFRIPLAGFTLVQESRPPTLCNFLARDPSVGVAAVTTYHLNDELQTHVAAEDTISGFWYGATLVPFTNEDLDKVNKKDEKCLSVIGFAKSESIPRYLYVGKKVVLFVANAATKNHSEGSDSEAFRHPTCTAVSALAQALAELESVALVRRVYSRASAPALGILAPRITSSGSGLLYHELAFREDVRTFTLPSLPLVMTNEDEDNSDLLCKEEKWRPNNDQLHAMDAFVSSMMLDDDNCVGDEDDCVSNAEIDDTASAKRVGLRAAITPERVPNPWILRFFSLVRERGLGNPPLPEVPILTNGWPSLNPTVLPGLDSAILSIEKELKNTSGSSLSSLGRALRAMNRVMPEIIRAPGVDVIPKRKRKDHMAKETVIRKRQAMMSELFGIRDHSGLNETNLTLVASAVSGKQRAEPAEPVGDFNEFSRPDQDATLRPTSSRDVPGVQMTPVTVNHLISTPVKPVKSEKEETSSAAQPSLHLNALINELE